MILISLDYHTISSWLRTSLRDYMAFSPLYLHPTTDTQTRKVWTIRYFILVITKILPISKLTLFTLLLNFLRHCCHVLAGENWECKTHKTVSFFKKNALFLPCLFSLISFLLSLIYLPFFQTKRNKKWYKIEQRKQVFWSQLQQMQWLWMLLNSNTISLQACEKAN